MKSSWLWVVVVVVENNLVLSFCPMLTIFGMAGCELGKGRTRVASLSRFYGEETLCCTSWSETYTRGRGYF